MAQGFVILVIGMATVFAFLILLVFAMQLMAAGFKKHAQLFPGEVEDRTVYPSDQDAVIAVALAAIRAKKG
ncbi:OadG family protein [Kiritimatiellota bacterium B12222]|nr:OadG family protein [Kiritimatiellota bacterium B12222]